MRLTGNTGSQFFGRLLGLLKRRHTSETTEDTHSGTLDFVVLPKVPDLDTDISADFWDDVSSPDATLTTSADHFSASTLTSQSLSPFTGFDFISPSTSAHILKPSRCSMAPLSPVSSSVCTTSLFSTGSILSKDIDSSLDSFHRKCKVRPVAFQAPSALPSVTLVAPSFPHRPSTLTDAARSAKQPRLVKGCYSVRNHSATSSGFVPQMASQPDRPHPNSREIVRPRVIMPIGNQPSWDAFLTPRPKTFNSTLRPGQRTNLQSGSCTAGSVPVLVRPRRRAGALLPVKCTNATKNDVVFSEPLSLADSASWFWPDPVKSSPVCSDLKAPKASSVPAVNDTGHHTESSIWLWPDQSSISKLESVPMAISTFITEPTRRLVNWTGSKLLLSAITTTVISLLCLIGYFFLLSKSHGKSQLLEMSPRSKSTEISAIASSIIAPQAIFTADTGTTASFTLQNSCSVLSSVTTESYFLNKNQTVSLNPAATSPSNSESVKSPTGTSVELATLFQETGSIFTLGFVGSVVLSIWSLTTGSMRT